MLVRNCGTNVSCVCTCIIVCSQYGITQMPKSAYMIILYSSFLLDVQNSYQSGYSQLQVGENMTHTHAHTRMRVRTCHWQTHSSSTSESKPPGAVYVLMLLCVPCVCVYTDGQEGRPLHS